MFSYVIMLLGQKAGVRAQFRPDFNRESLGPPAGLPKAGGPLVKLSRVDSDRNTARKLEVRAGGLMSIHEPARHLPRDLTHCRTEALKVENRPKSRPDGRLGAKRWPRSRVPNSVSSKESCVPCYFRVLRYTNTASGRTRTCQGRDSRRGVR